MSSPSRQASARNGHNNDDDDSFEEHRLHFLKMLGLSPSTTRVPQTPPPPLHQTSSQDHPPSQHQQQKQQPLWTFVGNVSEEELRKRSYSSPAMMISMGEKRPDFSSEEETQATNIPAVERHVSRSVDFLLLSSSSKTTNATPTSNKSRSLLHLSPSRVLSKEEFKQSVAKKNHPNNAKSKLKTETSLLSSSSSTKRKHVDTHQQLSSNAAAAAAAVDNKQLRYLAFKSPARWKHTSSFDIHSFLPSDTFVNFDEEEAKALEKLMKDHEQEKETMKSKKLGTKKGSASTSEDNSSNQSDRDELLSSSSSVNINNKNSLDQNEVARSLLDASSVIKKLIRALKIERETNSTRFGAKSGGGTTTNPTAGLATTTTTTIPSALPNAEEFLEKFNARYSYLYRSDSHQEEFEREQRMKDLQSRVKSLENEKSDLIRRHKDEISRIQSAQLNNNNNNNNNNKQTFGMMVNNNHLTPHYALPTSSRSARTPTALTGANRAVVNFTFSSTKEVPPPHHHHLSASVLRGNGGVVGGSSNNNNPSQLLQRSSSNLSNMSMNSRKSSMNSRPKKDHPHQQQSHATVIPSNNNNNTSDFVSNQQQQQQIPIISLNNDDNSLLDGFGEMMVVEGNDSDDGISSITSAPNSSQNTRARNSPVHNDEQQQSSSTVVLLGPTSVPVVNHSKNSNNSNSKPSTTNNSNNHSHNHHNRDHFSAQQSSDDESATTFEVESLRKMNRELRDSLESIMKERDEYQLQLNDALKQLVGVDSSALKKGSELKKNVSVAIEALMTQVKNLSDKNRLLEEKLFLGGPAAVERKKNNPNADPTVTKTKEEGAETPTAKKQNQQKKKTVQSEIINSKNLSALTGMTDAHNNSNNRSASSATIMSVQSSGVNSQISGPTPSKPKRSPMTVKSPNPQATGQNAIISSSSTSSSINKEFTVVIAPPPLQTNRNLFVTSGETDSRRDIDREYPNHYQHQQQKHRRTESTASSSMASSHLLVQDEDEEATQIFFSPDPIRPVS